MSITTAILSYFLRESINPYESWIGGYWNLCRTLDMEDIRYIDIRAWPPLPQFLSNKNAAALSGVNILKMSSKHGLTEKIITFQLIYEEILNINYPGSNLLYWVLP